MLLQKMMRRQKKIGCPKRIQLQHEVYQCITDGDGAIVSSCVIDADDNVEQTTTIIVLFSVE